MLLTYN